MADLVDQDIDDQKFAASLKPFLDEATVERTVRRRFVPRDSAAIRDVLWAREIAEATAKDVPNEVDRVVQLFAYVTNNMRLIADSKQTLPLAPFDNMLLGGGTANDRAWAFAVLLQQLRITAVIVDPASDAASDVASQMNAPVLVGFAVRDGTVVRAARGEKGRLERVSKVIRPLVLSKVL